MNPELLLQEAFKEWRRLTDTQRQAINSGHWTLHSECHAALRKLQPRLGQLIQSARRQWGSGREDLAQKQQHLDCRIRELIELESQNLELLEKTRRSASERMAQLGRAGRLLRQVQKSYAGATSANWTPESCSQVA